MAVAAGLTRGDGGGHPVGDRPVQAALDRHFERKWDVSR
jgi:hypothetical protein